MKKILTYISIIILVAGIFIPLNKTDAAGQCWNKTQNKAMSGDVSFTSCTAICKPVAANCEWRENAPVTISTPTTTKVPTPVTTTGCYYSQDGPFGQKEGALVQSNPPLTVEQCGLNKGYNWFKVGETTPSAPLTAYQQCINNDAGNYENCKILSGAPKIKPNVVSSPDITKDTKYVLLAPLPCPAGTFNCDENGQLTTYNFGGSTPIGSYLNIMIRIFIGLCAVLAMVMIVVGGVEYMMSELISSKESGKQKITGAVFGLILALSSWALLNTINPDLLNTDSTNLTDVTVVVNISDEVPQTYNPTTKQYKNGAIFGTNWQAIAGKANGLPAFASLNNAGRECVTVGENGCTSTAGLDTTPLYTIHNRCNSCQLVVTGGTEFWKHGGESGSTTHNMNSATIDIRTDSILNGYIAGNKPLIKFTRYSNGDGLDYYYEGNHWHIGR